MLVENRESSALFRDIIIYPLYNNRTNVTTAKERDTSKAFGSHVDTISFRNW